jgi:pimeloyl-ACP methyl ester carboxylesterase
MTFVLPLHGETEMSGKTPLQDLVVILPGILGSVLQKDNQDIWAASVGIIGGVLTNKNKFLRDLKLQKDDPDVEDLGDGIKAVRLVEDVSIVPGLFKVDGYTRTTRMITENFLQVTQGNIYLDPDDRPANLYHFPYDWRRDNRVAAKTLKRLLDKRLKCWREHTSNPNAKVILLAHSMGGLVSRYYLEVLGGWPDCKALFTFGTPYRGSLNAVDFLANGYKQAFLDLTEVMRSLTAVYQLMPRYKALKIGNDFYRIAESPVALPNIDRARAADALKFHNEIDDAADINWKNLVYRNSCVTCPIVGIVQPTKQSAELVNGMITTSDVLPAWLATRPNLGDGDGTVPQVSAIPAQMKDIDTLAFADYIAESHGALQNQPDTLLNLLKRIQAVQTVSSEDARGGIEFIAPRGIEGVKGIGLALDDLYLVNELILMSARVGDGATFSKLIAEISNVSQNSQTIVRNFEVENDRWVLTTENLAAGTYRVKVQTDNPNEDAPTPVNNFFVVTETPGGE